MKSRLVMSWSGLAASSLRTSRARLLDPLGPGHMAPFGPHQRDIVLFLGNGALELRGLLVEPPRLELHIIDQYDEPCEETEGQK